MHAAVLVMATVAADQDKTREEAFREAVEDAEDTLGMYENTRFDYYNADSPSVKDFMVDVNGNKCRACRASEFKEFKNDELPLVVVNGAYIDSYIMEKYGVDWETVVEREIKETQEQDIGEFFEQWFVVLDIHY